MKISYLGYLHTVDDDEYRFIVIDNWESPEKGFGVQTRKSSKSTHHLPLDGIPIRSFFTLVCEEIKGTHNWTAFPATPDSCLKLKSMSNILNMFDSAIIRVNEMEMFDLEEEIPDAVDLIDDYVIKTRNSLLDRLV